MLSFFFVAISEDWINCFHLVRFEFEALGAVCRHA